MLRLLIVSIVSMLFAALPAASRAQTEWTVGPDAACDFSSVQSAIDAAADGDTIRLMAGPAGSGFQILSKALTLVGGHDDCTSPTIIGLSTFDQQGTGLVADIFYNGAPADPVKRVVLENLVIRGGGSFGFFSGGLLIEGTPGRLGVALNNVQVINNDRTDPADHGGGIRVLTTRDAPAGSNLLMLTIDDDSLIANNSTAGKGGGIYCESTHDTSPIIFLILVGKGLIFGNEAGSHGGGIAINGCEGVLLSNGGPVALLFPTGGIVNNISGTRGGGIYVENGGTVSTLARPDHSVLISNNQAANGGGVSVSDAGSIASLSDTWVIDNSANFGGGLDVRSGAALFMNLNQPCQDAVVGGGQLQYLPCSVLADNEAIGGGAVQIGGASRLDLRRTIVRDNAATGKGSTGGGAAIRATNSTIYAGTPTEVRLEGALLHDNSGTSLFLASNAVDLELRHVTAAGNNTPTLFQNAAASGQTTAVRAESSILQGSTWRSDSGVGTITLALDCVIGNAAPGATGADSLLAYSGGVNPKYIDINLPDYRLQLDSPAIDYCDDRHANSGRDLDNNPRGIAWVGPTPQPSPGGGLGDHDLGAYETPFAPTSVDLAVEASAVEPFVAAGQPVEFRIRVQNQNGASAAFGDIVVSDGFSAGSVVNVQWTCTAALGVSCTPASGSGPISAVIGTMGQGQSVAFEISAQLANPNADGSFQYLFEVSESAFNFDSNPSNNAIELQFTSGLFADGFEPAGGPPG